jgi:8-oxo-dGTP pyrophosphatase MutT (NUDIX family)
MKKTIKKPDYATYHVGLKILLKKGDDFLFLTEATGQRFDLPGGRIDDTEHAVPLTKIVAREVREELGAGVKYTLGNPVFHFRRHLASKGWHVFIVVYEAEYLSGQIKLSDEHSNYQWLNPKKFDFKEKHFYIKEEFLAFRKYFKSLR